jgi:hypothetical protein
VLTLVSLLGVQSQNTTNCPALVAYACNPSYSGGRDQEDHGLKPIWANSSHDHLEKPFTKIGLVEWIKVKALSSSSSTAKSKTEQQKS